MFEGALVAFYVRFSLKSTLNNLDLSIHWRSLHIILFHKMS